MLIRKTCWRKYGQPALLLFLIGICAWEFISFSRCAHYYYQAANKDGHAIFSTCFFSGPISASARFWHFFSRHSEAFFLAVSAAATIAIAAFTLSLRDSTDKLARLTKRQLAIVGRQTDILDRQHGLERLQFVTDKRPRLRVRNVIIHTVAGVPTFQAGRKITGDLVVVNYGGTEATIKASPYHFIWSDCGLPMDPALDTENALSLFMVPAKLGAGGSCVVGLESASAMDHHADDILHAAGNWRLYLVGTIRYSDISFPPVERFMGYCREYKLKGSTQGRFYPVKDEPDYDYED